MINLCYGIFNPCFVYQFIQTVVQSDSPHRSPVPSKDQFSVLGYCITGSTKVDLIINDEL